MKKRILYVMVVVLSCLLSACSSSKENKENNSTTSPVETTEDENTTNENANYSLVQSAADQFRLTDFYTKKNLDSETVSSYMNEIADRTMFSSEDLIFLYNNDKLSYYEVDLDGDGNCEKLMMGYSVWGVFGEWCECFVYDSKAEMWNSLLFNQEGQLDTKSEFYESIHQYMNANSGQYNFDCSLDFLGDEKYLPSLFLSGEGKLYLVISPELDAQLEEKSYGIIEIHFESVNEYEAKEIAIQVVSDQVKSYGDIAWLTDLIK